MGVIKRRRSRRLLETRKVAESQGERVVTTQAAASAWGDMLVRESEPPEERLLEEPSPSVPPLRAPLRGVPLSSRPPSALPPDLSDEAPRPRSTPSRSMPPERSPAPPADRVSVTGPTPERARPPASDPPAPGQAPTSVAPDAWPSESTGLPAWPDEPPVWPDEPPVWPDEPPARLEEPAEPPPEDTRAARTTLEVLPVTAAAPAPAPGRSVWPLVVLVVLLLGAIAWTGAVLFDEMGRTERLERVGKALSAAGQRIASEHPELARWPGPQPDAVALQQMIQAETPRLVEAVAAAGYTPGVFSVAVREHPADAAVVLEAQVPEATIAFITGGKWLKPPPETGMAAALKANIASIGLSFALPLGLFIFLVVRRRRGR
ncbi:MAG: hypothetical protein H6706_11650 [Myxococcales bacterium]|nr:hypothetical protein [Myxococcales bacterium]